MASTNVQSPKVERIIISLPKELLDSLNRLAKRKGLQRGSLIRMILTERAREMEKEEDRES